MGRSQNGIPRNNSDYAIYQLAKYYYSNSQNSVYSRNSSSVNSNDGSYMFDEKIIPKLVEKMIREKFKGTLSRIRQRSFERRKSRLSYFENTYEEILENQIGSDDSGLNNSSLEDFAETISGSRKQENIYERIKTSRLSLGTLKSRTISTPFNLAVSNIFYFELKS